jgi:hypothetical protein
VEGVGSGTDDEAPDVADLELRRGRQPRFPAGDAYKRTNRYSVNLVFSPTPRIDCGIEYIYGTRANLDG